MQKVYNISARVISAFLFLSAQVVFPYISHASVNSYDQKGPDLKNKNFFDVQTEDIKSVELQADQVQFSQDTNKATASGNVVVTAKTSTLYADQLELEKAIGEAVASGHVYVDSTMMQVSADRVKYNFNNTTGEFQNARIFSDSLQIRGETVNKVSENHFVMQNGFLTTCDHDQPHFRLQTHQMDVYVGDKAIARGVTMYAGNAPIMYLPKYVQDLKDQPIFTFIPGYKKDFGAFLLTTLRLKLSDQLKVTVHGDFRERTGVAEGVDVRYKTPNFGEGILRTYYTDEHLITSKHLWDSNRGPTSRHELYRVEWRHQWKIDQDTSAIWQYYKIHDYDLANMGFLKRYFEREYRQGPDVNTYFVLTKNLPAGALTYRMDVGRVNKSIRGVERLPEVQYDLSGQKLGDTNFYLKSTDTFSNLINKQDINNGLKTVRLDVDNEISYPKKVGIVEFRPFVGGEHTYYSRTVDVNDRSVIRGQFKTGADITTHFYRIWDYHKNIWGMEFDGLRHVVTPSITYTYKHLPTMSASHFNQFDSIDALARTNNIHLSLENKLQTRRNKQSVDLIRTIVESDYQLLKDEPGRGLGPIKSLVEIAPTNWLSFKADQTYDHKADHWIDANFDAFIANGDQWSFGLGKRYARDVNDQITTELKYKINPIWRFRIYNRFTVDSGTSQAQELTITRDLHEWEMDFNLHQERGSGTGFFVVFRLKAFPGMGLDMFSNSFHQRKAGAQSSSTN